MAINEDFRGFLRTMRDVHRRRCADSYSTVNHVALRVRDLGAAGELLSKAFGIGPVVKWPEEYGLMPGEESIGVFWLGDLYFELIQQTMPETKNEDGLPPGFLVEIGFFVKDMEAELGRLAKEGYAVLWRGGGPGAKFAHLDTTPPSGIPVELIEITPEIDRVLGP